MRLVEFIKKEDGAITVDWVVLSTAVAVLCLAAAGVLTAATNSFTNYNARELALQNYGGENLFDTANYTPEHDALYEAYVNWLAGLSLEQLDAVAGFANRLHAAGYGEDVGGADETGCNAGNGRGYGVGYCRNQERNNTPVANTNDFLMAVDQAYAERGAGRPTHTRIDSANINAAFQHMGLSQAEVRALLQS